MRSQQGDDSPENIMLVTEELHRWIHANPGISYARGWLVKSHEDPAKIPVQPHPELRFECHICECGGQCDNCQEAA
jgi:hypothetical protein